MLALLVILLTGLGRASFGEISSGMEPFCSYQSTTNKLDCLAFQSFKDLDFSSIKVKPSILNLEPSGDLKLQLNSDFDPQGLVMDWSYSTQNVPLPPKITLKNIYGLDQYSRPFKAIKFLNNTERLFQLEIFESELNFVAYPNYCGLDENNKDEEYIFSSLNLERFLIQDSRFWSNTSLCPIYFSRSRIQSWTFVGLDPVYYSQIYSNYDNTMITNLLDIRVENLKLRYAYDDFLTELNDRNLLNEFIFDDIETLEFDTVFLEKIDVSTFEKFTSINSIKILNTDLELLFKNGLGWMKFLNPKK
jgi:hypothetical protein